MATVKIDKKISNTIRKARVIGRYSDGTAKQLLSLAVRYLDCKHDECFVCPFHKDQVAGLELGRQQLALESTRKGKSEDVSGEWVPCGDEELRIARAIAKNYRRTAKQVVEQAVLEHLTRPPNCADCPFFSEMRKKVLRGKEG